ncbi:MAG: glyoxylate reductase [Acidilobaceae archaeon]|nr:glyoxylate reductase [Acidilobaceae archaeon]
MPKLFVTRELFPDVLERLAKYYELEVWDRYKEPPYEVLLRKSREADAFLSLLTDRIDCNLLSGSRLRIVAQYAVGFDNVDVKCATEHGIYVTNTPGVLTEATAEHTWALILSLARRIVEADHYVRWGEWWRVGTAWHPLMLLGVELEGKTLGVVGIGRIGSRVAEIAKAFRMRVVYYDVERKRELEEKLGIEYRELDDLLAVSDIVTLHTPLTPETRYLINEERLRRMKRGSLLINTARGAVVDTNALVKALREGWIAGAALDVFEREPLEPNHPLLAFKNVVVTPHIASATSETRRRMAELAAENLIAFYEGKEPPTLVNKEVVRRRSPGFG